MSRAIDERIVEMQFDNDQFEKGVAETSKTLEKFKKDLNLDGASKGFEELDRAAARLDLKGINAGVQQLNESFNEMWTISFKLINSFKNNIVGYLEKTIKGFTIEPVTQGWTKYADKTRAVQTIMAATREEFLETGNQMEVVEEQLSRLTRFTDETSYRFTDMVSNIGKFTATGAKLGDSVTAMEGIATWASISGATVNEASRAMYNLSQAMGVGALKLMDWKSIENANMGTAEFKKTAMETAVELGKLTKVSDDLYKTINGKTEITIASFRESLQKGWLDTEVLTKTLEKYGKVSEIIIKGMDELGADTVKQVVDAVNAFKDGTRDMEDIAKDFEAPFETVQKIIGELADDANDLGLRAFKAAYETKTFQEAIEYVGEAVGSSWMTTWEIIFGNYEDAKKLWSDMAEWLYRVFVIPGENRNELLEEWKKLGGRDSFVNGFMNALEGVEKIVKNVSNAFRALFPAMDAPHLVYATQIFEKAMIAFNNAMTFVESEAAEFRHQIDLVKKEFEEVTQPVVDAKEAIDEFAKAVIKGDYGNGAERVEKLGDAYKIVQNHVNELLNCSYRYNMTEEETQKAMIALGATQKKYTDQVDETSDSLDELIEKSGLVTTAEEYRAKDMAMTAKIMRKNLKYYKEHTTVGQRLHDALLGVFSALKMVADAALALNTHIIQPLVSYLVPKLVDGITSLTGQWGLLLLDLYKSTIEGDTFNRIFGKMRETFTGIINGIKDVIGQVKNLESYQEFVEYIKEFFEFLKGLGDDVFTGIKGFFESFDGFMQNETDIKGFVDLFDGLFKSINTVIEFLSPFTTAVGKAMKSVSTFIRGLKKEDLAFIGEGFTIALGAMSKVAGAISEYYHKLTGGEQRKIKNALSFGFLAKEESSIRGFVWNLDNVIGVFRSLFGEVEKSTDKVDDFRVAIKDVAEPITKTMSPLQSFFAPIGGILQGVGSILSDLFSRIISFIHDGGITKLLEYIRSGAVILGILAFAKVLMSLAGALDGVASIAYGVSGVLSSVRGLIDTAKNAVRAGIILIFAGALLVLAGALAMLAKIAQDGDALERAVHALGTMGMLLAALMIVAALMAQAGALNAAAAAGSVLAIAGAFLLIAGALKLLTDMPLETVLAGLGKMVFIFILLFGVAAALQLISKSMTLKEVYGFVATLVGVYILTMALKKVIDTMLELNDLPIKDLLPRFFLIIMLMGLLSIIMIAVAKLDPKAKGSVNLLATIVSLWLLIKLLERFDQMDMTKIYGALLKMIPIFGALFLISAAVRLAGGNGSFGMAATLIGLGVSLMLIAKAIKILSGINPGMLIVAGAVIGGLMYVITSMIGAVGLLGKTNVFGWATFFIALSIAILAMSVAIRLLSKLPVPNLIFAGAAVIGMLWMISKIVEASREAQGNLAGLIALTVFIGVLAAAVYALSLIPDQSKMMASALGLGLLMVGLSTVIKSTEALKEASILKAIAAILVVGAFVWACAELIKSMAQVVNSGQDAMGYAGAITILLFDLAAMTAAAQFLNPALVHQGVIALSEMAMFIGAILTVLGAVYGLGGAEYVNGALDLLVSITTKLGEAVGGIIGGFVTGVTKDLETAANNLSKFAESIKPFMEFTKGLDGNMVTKVGALKDLLGALHGLKIDSKLYENSGNGSKIGEAFSELAKGLVTFSNELENISMIGMFKIPLVLPIIDTLSTIDLSQKRDWTSFLTGSDEMARQLSAFAAELNASGFNSATAARVEAAASAIQKLADINMPRTGGFFQKIFGEEMDFDTFRVGLGHMGNALIGIGKTFAGADDETIAGMEKGVQMIQKFADINKAMPKHGGLITDFLGDNDWSTFVKGLNGSFAIALIDFGKKCAKNITDENIAGVDKAIEMTKSLVGLVQSFPDAGGKLQQWFGGKGTWESFKAGLPEFGEALKSFSESTAFLGMGAYGSAGVDLTYKLIDLANSETDTTKMYQIGEAIAQLSLSLKTFYDNTSGYSQELGGIVDNIVNAFTGSISSIATANMVSIGDTIATLVVGGIDLHNTKFANSAVNSANAFFGAFSSETVSAVGANAGRTLLNYIRQAFNEEYDRLISDGNTIANKVIEGVSQKNEYAKTTGHILQVMFRNGINDYTTEFADSGRMAANGFVNGIYAIINSGLVAQAGNDLAQAALDAVKRKLDEHSPSRAMAEIGSFAGEGFVGGMKSWFDTAARTGSSLADNALNGLRTTLSLISEAVSSDIDVDPVITPVLDLTNIQSGARRLNNLISTNPMVGANRFAVNEVPQNVGENTGSNGITFVQNNYSPKALSRSEIYRQTRNQISVAKGMVEA